MSKELQVGLTDFFLNWKGRGGSWSYYCQSFPVPPPPPRHVQSCPFHSYRLNILVKLGGGGDESDVVSPNLRVGCGKMKFLLNLGQVLIVLIEDIVY